MIDCLKNIRKKLGTVAAGAVLTASAVSVLVSFDSSPVLAKSYKSKIDVSRKAADVYLDSQSSSPKFRQFMQAMPKGGDIHNHLYGLVYAENWIDWAAEDGLCVDMSVPAIRMSAQDTGCSADGLMDAEKAATNEELRRQLINGLSLRSFVPYAGWSGHNQFFETFFRMLAKPERFGDMLAEGAERAAHQNILYLELMHTIVLMELLPLTAGIEMTGDAAVDYKALMASPFGAQMPALVQSIKDQIDAAEKRKNLILQCGTEDAKAGCGVEMRLLHQVIRSFDPATVYAQIILGWEAMKQDSHVVGLNLVAPEDGYVALRDYDDHMEMIDHLYQHQGPRNVTLHAGELTLGLVMPKELKSHIHDAIHTAHAKRIGHGIDIAYEDGSAELLAYMRDHKIPVEVNITSNDVILGVKGKDHPLWLYRENDVPYTLSTDDEGVSRIDLTHEYMRAASEFSLPYFELKQVSRNALIYSFLAGDNLWDHKACVVSTERLYKGHEGKALNKKCSQLLQKNDKAKLQWRLEEKFYAFEKGLKLPRDRKKLYN